jgi:hypothetical protein
VLPIRPPPIRFSADLVVASGVALSIITAIVAVPARAQLIDWPPVNPPDLKPIYQILRPGYDPTGIDLGGFLLKPMVSETVAYNDNIFASNVHKADDVVSTTSEEMTFESQWSRHFLNIHFRTDEQIYAMHPQEDANTYLANMAGRFEISPTSFVEIDGVGGQLPEQRANPVALHPGGERPIFNLWAGSLTYYQRIDQFVDQFRIAINQNAFIFPQEVYQSNIDEIIGDRVSLDRGYALIPFVEVGYDINVQAYHPSRQSFENLTGSIGVHAHLMTVLDGEFAAGVRRETYVNPDFHTLVRPVIYGKLLWDVTPLTSIDGTLTFDYSGVESFCNSGLVCQISATGNVEPVVPQQPPGGALFETHRSTLQKAGIRLNVEHEIWHNLLGEISVEYDHDVFDLNNLVDNYYTAICNLRYLINRYSEFQISYEYRDRTASLPNDFTFNTGPFKENIISLTLKLQD